MDKQTATFRGVVEFRMYKSGEFGATLYNVKGHPKLGNESVVHTSALCKVEFVEGRPVLVETKNTVYTKETP